MKRIQNAINDYMEEKGVKISVLAEKCGWSEQKLSSILTGFHPLNSADYGKICEALGVNYNIFYYRSKGINCF